MKVLLKKEICEQCTGPTGYSKTRFSQKKEKEKKKRKHKADKLNSNAY